MEGGLNHTIGIYIPSWFTDSQPSNIQVVTEPSVEQLR